MPSFTWGGLSLLREVAPYPGGSPELHRTCSGLQGYPQVAELTMSGRASHGRQESPGEADIPMGNPASRDSLSRASQTTRLVVHPGWSVSLPMPELHSWKLLPHRSTIEGTTGAEGWCTLGQPWWQQLHGQSRAGYRPAVPLGDRVFLHCVRGQGLSVGGHSFLPCRWPSLLRASKWHTLPTWLLRE